MKKVTGMLVAAVAILTLAAGVSSAVTSGVVPVSSSTVTTISKGDGSRRHVIISNETTNPVYLGFSTSSTTVNAGFVLESSATSRSGASRVVIDDYPGPIYGLAGAGASATVKKLEVPR